MESSADFSCRRCHHRYETHSGQQTESALDSIVKDIAVAIFAYVWWQLFISPPTSGLMLGMTGPCRYRCHRRHRDPSACQQCQRYRQGQGSGVGLPQLHGTRCRQCQHYRRAPPSVAASSPLTD